jgi:acyl carrier protein
MAEETVIAQGLHELLRARAPLVQEPRDDLPIGAEGVGLDSIAVVELLLECGERFGVPAPVELLAEGPLTFGALVARLRAALGR